MARRIEIELTSRLDDSQWSWRAAGARQPKGTVESSIVPKGVNVGDIVKADVETRMDGIEITAIHAPSAAVTAAPKVERIELLGSGKEKCGVTWDLAKKSKKGPRRERDERSGKDGRDRRERSGSGPRSGRPSGGGPEGRGRSEGRGRPSAPVISTDPRNALLGSLESAQLPIAEQLLQGGIPAVRAAIQEQNAQARSAGQPEASSDAIMAIAEKLLPQTSLAMWKDRASSALAAGKETRLRDLRAVVSASRSVNLDDDGRAMAKTLQETLDHRANALSDEWVKRMVTCLDEGRTAEALRISARPPDHATRCPSDLATKLAEQASAAMTADADGTMWLELLEAVGDSPVRRNVKPSGIPADPNVQNEARKAAGLVPALATLLGLRIPPPPPRRTTARK